MENMNENPIQQEQSREEGYHPRPRWQVWSARVGVVIVLLLIVLQLLQIAGGGL